MTKIFEKALENANLRFIDEISGAEHRLSSYTDFLPNESQQQLVFAYLDNSIKSVIAFWLLLKSRHTIALLPPSLNVNLKVNLENIYRPKWILSDSEEERLGYEKISSNGFEFFQRISLGTIGINSEIKLLLSTSGTTGSPKFVKLSESNILNNAISIGQYLPIQGDDVTPLNLPIYYSYGLSILTSNCLFGGKIFCTNDDVLKKSFWEKFELYGFTSFGGVPYVYEMLDRIGFVKKKYPSLRYFTQAGGKLQDYLVNKYSDFALDNGVKFFVMYGQTEATARISYLAPEFLKSKLGSIGKAIPNGSLFLSEENQELCYSGPNIFGGYVESPIDLASFTKNEVLFTGDTARVDEDGFYFITGRLKRFVKIFGNRINLDEVESILAKEFNINSKCIGVNDKTLVVYVLESNFDEKLIIDSISKYLKIHISAIKARFIPEFPLTSNGKIDYTKLKSIYESN